MKALKTTGRYFITITICIAIFILMILICTLIPSILLSPKDTIFWVFGPWINLIFLFEIVLIIVAVSFTKGIKQKNKDTIFAKVPKLLNRYYFLIIFGVILYIYTIVIDTTYITNEKIVKREFFNPIGIKYSYSDVIGINTGFYGKRTFLRHYKGDFYYYIRLKDGTQIQLSNSGGINDELIENYDTYKEIEVIDSKLMQNNIIKIASLDFSEFCTLGSIYKNRCISIIQNK